MKLIKKYLLYSTLFSLIAFINAFVFLLIAPYNNSLTYLILQGYPWLISICLLIINSIIMMILAALGKAEGLKYIVITHIATIFLNAMVVLKVFYEYGMRL